MVSNGALSSFFRMLTTTPDQNGKVYVSSVEARNYPIYATQWHPGMHLRAEFAKRTEDCSFGVSPDLASWHGKLKTFMFPCDSTSLAFFCLLRCLRRFRLSTVGLWDHLHLRNSTSPRVAVARSLKVSEVLILGAAPVRSSAKPRSLGLNQLLKINYFCPRKGFSFEVESLFFGAKRCSPSLVTPGSFSLGTRETPPSLGKLVLFLKSVVPASKIL